MDVMQLNGMKANVGYLSQLIYVVTLTIVWINIAYPVTMRVMMNSITHQMNEWMNIALRRFLHNHGNIATEGSPKPGLCPTLISNDFKGSL